MARRIVSLASLLVLAVGGIFGMNWWEQHSPDAAHRDALAEKERRIAEEKQRADAERLRADTERQRAETFNQLIKRLTTSKRVAQVVVTEQKPVNGKPTTTLLFNELSRSGQPIDRPAIQVEGTGVHIDGFIIQFDDKSVADNDPLRGHSVILFNRVFGHHQSVQSAYSLDTPGDRPQFYDGADPKLAAMERELWADFWKLAENPAHAAKNKVKLAWGGSVYTDNLKVGQVYDLSLDPQGGLRMSLRMPGQ